MGFPTLNLVRYQIVFILNFELQVRTNTEIRLHCFIQVLGYTFVFFHLFSKGDNFHSFLFASLDDETLPKRSLLFKESHGYTGIGRVSILGVGGGGRGTRFRIMGGGGKLFADCKLIRAPAPN